MTSILSLMVLSVGTCRLLHRAVKRSPAHRYPTMLVCAIYQEQGKKKQESRSLSPWKSS